LRREGAPNDRRAPRSRPATPATTAPSTSSKASRSCVSPSRELNRD